MPVNEKNGNEELLEKGWQQMQGILQSEMPIKRNVKWGFWIPLTLLGIAVIVAAAMYFPRDKVNNTVPVVPTNPHQSFAQADQNTSPIQSTETSNDNVTASGLSAVSTGSHMDSATHNEEFDLSGAAALSERTSVVVSDGNKELDTRQQVKPLNEEGPAVKSDAQIGDAGALESKQQLALPSDQPQSFDIDSPDGNVDAQKVSSSNRTGFSETLLVTKAEDLQPVAKADNLQPVTKPDYVQHVTKPESLQPMAIDIVVLTSSDPKSIAGPIIPVATQLKSKVGLELFGAPHFASNVQLHGIEAGAMATLTLGRKWKLLGGASIGHYNQSGLIMLGGLSQNSDVETYAVPVIPDTAGFGSPLADLKVDYNQIGYDTAELLTEKFNYLHFPVLAQYRIGRIISVTGGVKVSYLLNAPSNKNLRGTTLNSAQGSPLDLTSSSNFLDEENILRKWDVAPVIGIALNIGRTLAIDLQYQHGLIPYVDRPTDNDRSDYHRTVSLGLRYRIL